ncbi:MAG: DUF2232 domain-containing protein [Alphaproteobacteria bacterium]
MPKTTGIALVGGVASALLFVALLTGSPAAMLFVYMVPLPLFLVGFSQGLAAAAIAAAGATAVTGAIGGVSLAMIFALVIVLPVLFTVRQALLSRPGPNGTTEWYPPGLLLGWLTGLAATALALVVLVQWGGGGDLPDAIRARFQEGLAQFQDNPDTAAVAARLEAWVDVLANFLPAILASVWLVVLSLNAIVAQGALARGSHAKRPSPRLSTIEPPAWVMYALAASLLAWVTGLDGLEFLGQNLTPVLAIPFFFVGLAVVHSFARRFPGRALILAAFYMILILLGFLAMLPVTAIGFAETWTQFRRRWAGAEPV